MLLDRVRALRAELLAQRRTLVSASLHGRSIDDLERPAVLAEELLGGIAPLVRDLYSQHFEITEVFAARNVNSKGSGRGRIPEFLIHDKVR